MQHGALRSASAQTKLDRFGGSLDLAGQRDEDLMDAHSEETLSGHTHLGLFYSTHTVETEEEQ